MPSPPSSRLIDQHVLDDRLRDNGKSGAFISGVTNLTGIGSPGSHIPYPVYLTIADTINAVNEHRNRAVRPLRFAVATVMATWPGNRRPHPPAGCESIATAAAIAGIPVQTIIRLCEHRHQAMAVPLRSLVEQLGKAGTGICYSTLLNDYINLSYGDTTAHAWLDDYANQEINKQKDNDDDQ